MGMLTTQNVDEYKQKYAKELEAKSAEIGREITDEMLTESIYKQLSGKADIDYYSFYKTFNPEGKYANLETYRVSNNDMESNDKDLINKAYSELQNTGNVRFKDFVNVFAPKPFDKEKYYDDFNIVTLNVPDKEYSLKEIAEIRGINPDTDVNLAEVGFAQALARDDVNKAMAAKEVLNRYFDEDIPIRMGEETEELEFLNPNTGKYELLNAYGLDAGDLAKFGTYGAFILPEIAATVVTTGIFPGSSIAVSAASSAALETLRLIAGHEIYGINKTEKGFKDYLQNEGKDIAVINAALTATGYTVPKLYRMFKDLRRFGKINASEFGGRIGSAEDAFKLAEKINDRLVALGTKPKLKFTLGQAGDDPELLALQNAYESNPKYGVKKIFDDFNEEQADALNTYMNLMAKEYNFQGLSGKDNILSDEIGQKIQQKIIERLSPKQKFLVKQLENAETDLTNAIIKFPDGSTKEAGTQIRNVIDGLYDDFEQSYTDKYTALFKTGGGRKIDTDIIKTAVKELNQRQKNTLFKKYPEIKTFFETPKGKKININTLKNTLSDLRRFDRDISKGKIPIEGSPVEGAVSKLIGSIKNQFKESLGEDDIWYREFLKLDKAYAKNKDLYKGVISKLMSTKNGRLVIANEDVFKQTFKKGNGQIQRIDDIYEILKKKPSAITTYKEQILGAYKQAVDPNTTGKINLVAHQKFLNDYQYALEKFFGGKSGFKQIENIGELAKKVETATLKRDKVLKQLGKSTEGKIESMDPDKIFAFLYNNKSPTTLNKVMTIIKQDKDLLNAFQTVAKDDLLFKVTDNRNNFVFDKFADYLKNNNQILTRTFADNPKFLTDLKLMRDALEITTRKSAQKTIGKAETALNDVIRARLGQFTVAGRTFTALKKIVRSDVDKQLAEIITDPKRLEDLIKLKNVKKDSKAAKQIITRLFGYYIFDERFFEDDQFTPTMIDFVDSNKISQNVKEAEETINLAQNTELDSRFNETVIPQGNISQTQSVNPNLLAQAQPQGSQGIMQNLSSTEQALLDPMEQVIARRT
tara:strand:- start:254 stop:3373 length:3120 start_codon:yes stop_codon:yes gene_type:complete